MFDFDLPVALGTLAVDVCQTSPTTGLGNSAFSTDSHQPASVMIWPGDVPYPPDPR